MPVPADERLVVGRGSAGETRMRRQRPRGRRRRVCGSTLKISSSGRAGLSGELAAAQGGGGRLLAEAGAASGEAFRERAALYEKRSALLADKEKTERDIKKLSGREETSSPQGRAAPLQQGRAEDRERRVREPRWRTSRKSFSRHTRKRRR